MSNVIFQVYGTLIIALFGFVLPIMAIALSSLGDGVKSLKQNYENAQRQAERNLTDEIKKREIDKAGMDYDLLNKNIIQLTSDKKRAERRLSYLIPNYIFSRSLIALGTSFGSFLIGLYFYNKIVWLSGLLYLISVGFLAWVIVIFWNSIMIIIEASSAVQDITKVREEKTLELLTTIADNSKRGDASLFIDHRYIQVFFRDKEIKDGVHYDFSINKPHTIKINLKNKSAYMFKTAELGFTFPTECIIAGKTIDSIYKGDQHQIIRFTHPFIQANSNFIEGEIEMTFLKTGIFEVNAFVKGENLKNKFIPFEIRVIE
jgi:hypothetical protein